MLVDLGRNDLSRVCRHGTVHVERFMEPERFSHVTHLVSEVVGELREDVAPVRPPARVLPRRHGLRRAEGARDAADLGARGLPPRPVRRRGRLRAAGRRPRHLHRDPDDRAPRRGRTPPGRRGDRRRLRPARRARGVPAQARRPRDARLRWRRRTDDPARRQLRLVHVQPRPPVRGARRRGRRAPQRRDRRGRGRAARARPTSSSHPGPGDRRLRRDRSRSSGGWRRRRRRSASASATRRSSRPSAARSARRKRLVHGKASAVDARRARASSPACRRASRPAATTRSRRPTCPTALEVSATTDDGEVMAVRHRELPVDGVQFHPESRAHARWAATLPRNFLEGAMIQDALAQLLDGRDLDRARGARGDGRDHGRRGDAGPDRRLPRRAAR